MNGFEHKQQTSKPNQIKISQNKSKFVCAKFNSMQLFIIFTIKGMYFKRTHLVGFVKFGCPWLT
jgi:hypothetical protein